MIGKPLFGKRSAQKLTKAALHPIAHHCVADLLGNRDPIAHTQPLIWPGKQDEACLRIAKPLVCRQEVGALGEYRWHGTPDTRNGPPKGARKPDRASAATRLSGRMSEETARRTACEITSGAEVLPATLATCAQNLATARGLLACKETVPTGTNEIAGLESPLHNILE